MITTPQNPTDVGMGTYNPLAMQFMTQGQMGYMPQAQFLTDSSYGAYRTLPGADMGVTQQQNMSMWQAYLQSRHGNVGGLTGDYFFNTYNPMQSQAMRAVQAQRKLTDSSQAGFGAAVGMGMDFGLPALGGMVGGIPGMIAGTALSMVMPNAGDLMAGRRRQARDLQAMSVPGIINGPDMAMSTGKGFSLQASARLGRGMREMAVDDFSFNQDDYTGFLKSGMSHGLLDYSGNSQQYSDTLKKLRGNVKMLTELMENKDVQEIFQDMKRLQTMGAKLTDMKSIGGMESMFARAAGMGHAEMVSTFGQQGALQFTQRGLTGYQGSLQAMGSAAAVTMAQRSGLIAPDALSRAGGKSGLTQKITDSTANSITQIGNTLLPGMMDASGAIDMSRVNAFMNGETSLGDAFRNTQQAIHDPTSATVVSRNKAQALHDMQENLGTVGMDMFSATLAKSYGQKILRGKGTDADAYYAGFKHMGYDEDAAKFKASQFTNPEIVEGMKAQMQITQRKKTIALEQEYKNSQRWVNKIAHGFRRVVQDASSSTFGEWDRKRSIRAQAAENERLGIIKSDDQGISSIMGSTELSDEEYAELEMTEEEGQIRGRDAVALQGSRGMDYLLDKVREDIGFKGNFLNSEKMSSGYKKTVEDEFGIDYGMIKGMVKGMKSKDVTMDGMAKRLAKAKGIDIVSAREMLQDRHVMRYVSNAAKQEGGNALTFGVQEDHRKGKARVSKRDRDQVNSYFEDARQSVYDLTGGDSASTDMLIDMASKAPNLNGQNTAMGAYALYAMKDKLDISGKSKEEMYQTAISLGMDQKQARMVTEGQTDVLDDHLKNVLKYSDEQITSLTTAAGTNHLRADQLFEKTGKANRSIRVNTMKAAKVNLESSLKEAVAATGEDIGSLNLKELMASPGKVKALLAKAKPGSPEHETLTQLYKTQAEQFKKAGQKEGPGIMMEGVGKDALLQEMGKEAKHIGTGPGILLQDRSVDTDDPLLSRIHGGKTTPTAALGEFSLDWSGYQIRDGVMSSGDLAAEKKIDFSLPTDWANDKNGKRSPILRQSKLVDQQFLNATLMPKGYLSTKPGKVPKKFDDDYQNELLNISGPEGYLGTGSSRDFNADMVQRSMLEKGMVSPIINEDTMASTDPVTGSKKDKADAKQTDRVITSMDEVLTKSTSTNDKLLKATEALIGELQKRGLLTRLIG